MLIGCWINHTIHQGKYTCHARNRYGKASKEMTLTILAGPTITMPSHLHIPYQGSKMVTCTTQSNPPSNVTWTKQINNAPRSQDVSVKKFKTSIRNSTINVTWSLGPGLYVCHAINEVDYQKASMRVDVDKKPTPTSSPTAGSGRAKQIVITSSATAGVFLLVLCLVTINRMKRNADIFAAELAPNKKFVLDTSRSIQEQILELPYRLAWEFSRHHIVLTQHIAIGDYGEVWQGVADSINSFNLRDKSQNRNIMRSSKRRLPKSFSLSSKGKVYPSRSTNPGQVIVKGADRTMNKDAYTALASDLKLMILIGEHKNIVNLLGASTLNGSLWVLLEHCSNGDLHNFLQSRNHFLVQWEVRGNLSSEYCCIISLMNMAIDVCNGMSFLSSHGIVHKNLSARTIFLSHHIEVKIADYGKSKYVPNHQDIHVTLAGEAISLRWQVPESLQFDTFTSSSDVWAFAVLLWELFTLGDDPYPEIPPHDLLPYLRSGQRLSSPDSCPTEVYDLMFMCWCESPMERPTFPSMLKRLKEILQRKLSSNYPHSLPSTTSLHDE